MQDPFDPNAWDGDNDGIVQEGTMWERPAVPGVNTNLPGQRHTRTKPREFPLDDADNVEFRLRARREDDRQMEEVLSTPVGQLINSYPEETEVLDATLRGVDDEILDIPLRDLPNENLPVQLDEAGRLRTDGTSFDEENIDEILDNIVPRWNRTSPGVTDSFYEGMRSQRDDDNRYAHMTSSELMYFEETLNDVIEGAAGAGPDEDLDLIEELRDSIVTANLAQDAIDVGTPDKANAYIDTLDRIRMSYEEDQNIGGARDIQGLLETIENARDSDGTWISINLEEQGMMLDMPDRRGMRSQRGMRSERYDIAHDSRDGKWHVIDTGNNNMRTGRSFDKHQDALREAIRMDNPRGGMRSMREERIAEAREAVALSAGPQRTSDGRLYDERTHGELVDAFRSDGLSMSEAEAEADRRMRNRFGDRWRQHPLNRDRRTGRGSTDGSYYERGRRGMRSTRPTGRARPSGRRNFERSEIDIDDVLDAEEGRAFSFPEGEGFRRDQFRTPAGQRARSRMRDASTDRAAQTQGMRSTRRRRGAARPGVDKFSDQDGQIWENLTDAERDAVEKAIKTEMSMAMHSLAWNDLPEGARTPRKPASMTPEQELEYIARPNTAEYAIKQFFDQHVRPDLEDRYSGDELEQRLAEYVFTDEDINRIWRGLDKAYPGENKNIDQLKDRLKEIQTYRNMVETSEKDGQDAFRFLEHLSPAGRERIYKRANGADKDRLKASKSSWGLGKGNRTPSTVGTGFDERQSNIAAQTGLRRRVGQFSREMADRIWERNENNRLRRALRRGQSGVPGFRRDESEGRSVVARRIAAARRKLRTIKGRKGIQNSINASEKNQAKKAIDFDSDGKLVVNEDGIQRISAATKALLGDREALREVRMKSKGTDTDEVNRAVAEAREALGKVDKNDTEALEAASEVLEQAELRAEGIFNQNREMAVIWDKQEMNGLPTIVDEDTFNDLIDSGYAVVGRGHGSQSNAADYLDDELRYLPGGGGEAAGKGEYWSDPRGQWSSWTTGNGNTVAVLGPNARRMSCLLYTSDAADE